MAVKQQEDLVQLNGTCMDTHDVLLQPTKCRLKDSKSVYRVTDKSGCPSQIGLLPISALEKVLVGVYTHN